MLKKILAQLKKYEHYLRYLIVGGLTTFINLFIFIAMRSVDVQLIVANTLAFSGAVVFAYFTNKRYVFEDEESKGLKAQLYQFFKFVLMRVGSFIVETILLYVMVYIGVGEIISKLAISILVIVLNYIISKRYIFSSTTNKQ